jgi:hypothetical protein
MEWEPAFRLRIESVIEQLGGPGKVQDAAHIKSQTLQKIRKGGSRLALFAVFCEVHGVNPTWLLLGDVSEPRFRRGGIALVADSEVERVAVPDRRPARQAVRNKQKATRK